MCIGIPMQVARIEPGHAVCAGRGETRRVRTALVGEVALGEWLLVFIDSAQERLDPDRAQEITATLALLQDAMNGLPAMAADTAFELAREMDIDAGAMTRTLDRLEAKGLIERVRSETDRRVVHLKLTAEGEAAAEQVPHVLADVNNDFLRGFTKPEWTQLKDFLQRMLVNGEALQEEKAEETE